MKRIVCSFDGTWNDQDPKAPPTNVAKLHRAIRPRDRKGIRQYVRYLAGIASDEGMRFAFVKGAIGLEVGARIKLAYSYLMDVYEPGDEIYLFGFSRGAFEARSLASFISLFGIARPDSEFSIGNAWDLYRRSDHERNIDAVAELSASCHYPVRIRCIGVWDTVGNIGNPLTGGTWSSRRLAFHDMRLHDTIDVALHALSVDEIRGPFRPSLFTLPAETSLGSHQHVEQVWFPGTHADIGGGWPETALSDAPLLWMADRVSATTDLDIDFDQLSAIANPDCFGAQHASATGWVYAFSRAFPFIRLVRQNDEAISPARRRWFRSWRSSKTESGFLSLNEAIHESARRRFGETVIEMHKKRPRKIIYEPRSLAAAMETDRMPET
ncbi:DUF2235 domain-containing protein [Hyphomicrobium methylovorum]|uniref:DUF2235 domain-containing protein n=1 Tax=Hyphomicrobium methylovorum TaxID=84 RepID=UPI0015E7A8DB|nr:DUF2235 domain-containing protein [Hyphomicrobium methylovorum]MBA2126912.1 DUF2235 domain-containing protein [Hyphomicrobium methylovorum]